MEHQRHGVVGRIASRLGECLAIDRNLLADLGDRLAEQVGEHVGADPGCLTIRLGIAGGRDPYGKLSADRSRLGDDAHLFAVRRCELDRLAAPEATHGFDIAEHRRLVVGRRILRPQQKVLRHPTRGECHTRAAIAEVVDHRPFLDDARRVMQRQHTASGADIEIFRDRGNGRTGDGRIGIGAAESVEMPFRRPDGAKAVTVGVARAVEQKLVLARADAVIVAPEEQAEVRAARSARRSPRRRPPHAACRSG